MIHTEASVPASPFVSRTKPPEPFTLVLFGATGDLAARKLLPALAGLLKNGHLPQQFATVGIGRRDKTDASFRADVQKDLARMALPKFRRNNEGLLA